LDLHEALYASLHIMLLVVTRENREFAGLFPNTPIIHNTSCDSTITG
jgi:hypothetical protein